MAEYSFQIKEVRTHLPSQSILITCTLDVDEESLTARDFYLVNDRTNRLVPFALVVERNTITLHLKEWASTTDTYTLIAQESILSVTGERITMPITRNLRFEGAILSSVVVTSPKNFEEINGPIYLAWHEVAPHSQDKVHAYYLELASDNGFNEIIYRAYIDKKDEQTEEGTYFLYLKEVSHSGQYFLRMRVQEGINGDRYGEWKDIVTFTRKEECEIPPIPLPEGEVERAFEPTDAPPIFDLIAPKEQECVPTFNEYHDILPTAFHFTYPTDIDISKAKITIVREDV